MNRGPRTRPSRLYIGIKVLVTLGVVTVAWIGGEQVFDGWGPRLWFWLLMVTMVLYVFKRR